MSEYAGGTYFYHVDGHRLGDAPKIIPITLYQGMQITIHGHEETFEVVEWNYHYGHGDEEAGLRIILKPRVKDGTWSRTPFLR